MAGKARDMKLLVKVHRVRVKGASEVVSLVFGRDKMVYGGLTGEKGHLFFRYNPVTDEITDLGHKVVSGNILYDRDGTPFLQKVHKALALSSDGKIYGATGQNIGFGIPHYRTEDDEGGHVFSYDAEKDECIDIGVPLRHEWIINLTCDVEGENLYGMTYPLNHIFHCDPAAKKMRIIEQVHGGTFGDSGCSHEIICDSKGNLYGSYSSGYLFKYDVRKDLLMETDIRLPGGDWRIDSLVRDKDGMIYGGTWENGYLFSFNPEKGELKKISQPNRGPRLPAIGIHKGILYGASGGGDTYKTRTAFLFRYDVAKAALEELGDIFSEREQIRGQRMHAIAIGDDGTIYLGETGATTTRVQKEEGGYIRTGVNPYLFVCKVK